MNRLVSTPARLLIAAAMFPAATGAALAARPDTRAYSCAQNQAAVQQYKSIVMTTGQHTYARIVAGVAYCGPGQHVKLEVAPALDTPSCQVGYTCIENPFDD